MSKASFEEDIAKVLMGAYKVVVVHLPARTHDFINNSLDRRCLLDEADLGVCLFRNIVRITPEFSVELVLINGTEDFRRPFLTVTLLFTEGEEDARYASGTEVINKLPESIVLKSEMVELDLECHLRIVREKEGEQ